MPNATYAVALWTFRPRPLAPTIHTSLLAPAPQPINNQVQYVAHRARNKLLLLLRGTVAVANPGFAKTTIFGAKIHLICVPLAKTEIATALAVTKDEKAKN